MANGMLRPLAASTAMTFRGLLLLLGGAKKERPDVTANAGGRQQLLPPSNLTRRICRKKRIASALGCMSTGPGES